MGRTLVFVYGTLKQNEPNHHWLIDEDNGKSCLIGIGTTIEKYPLVIASRYYIPFALAAPGEGEHIQGEVYEVDDKMLANLDVLESHPNFYERKIIKIQLEDSEEEVDCWIYLIFSYKLHMMDLPFLKAYSSKVDPCNKYVPRHLRQDGGCQFWADVKC